MLHRVLPIGLVLCCLSLVGGHADPAPKAKSVLDDLPGLQRPVTFSEAKIPLGELVDRVAKQTGTKLYANRTTLNEPVALVVNEMPAVRLLNQLATFFDYRWAKETTASGIRYSLYQDVKQAREEEALRTAAQVDEQKRLEILLRAYAKVGQLSDAEYTAQRDELELHPQGKGPRPSVEEDRIHRGLRECDTPAKRALAKLLGKLTGQDWQALWQGQRLRWYSKPEAGERGLPPDLAQVFRDYRPSQSWREQRLLTRFQDKQEVANRLRQGHEQQDRYWAAADGVRVVIRLNRAAEMGRLFGRERAAPSLTAAVTPLVNNPPDGQRVSMQPEMMRVWIWATTTQIAWGYDPPERLAALEKDPVFSTPQPFAPKNPPAPDWLDRLSFGPIPKLLPDMAKSYGVAFLADAYWPTPFVKGTAFPAPMEGAAPTPQLLPLNGLLNRLSGRFENDINKITYNYYRWDRDDKLVQLRDRTWFFDRVKEIPLPVVTRWTKMLDQKGALTLDDVVNDVAALTDDQWDVLLENRYSPVFPTGFNSIPSWETDRQVLRLFRALHLAQRQRLERGAPIPWTEMNAAQRNLFLGVVEDQSLKSSLAVTQTDLAGADLVMQTEPRDLLRRTQGGTVREAQVSRGSDPKKYPMIFDDLEPEDGVNDVPPGAPNAAKPPLPITYKAFPVISARLIVRCGRAEPAVTSLVLAPSSR